MLQKHNSKFSTGSKFPGIEDKGNEFVYLNVRFSFSHSLIIKIQPFEYVEASVLFSGT